MKLTTPRRSRALFVNTFQIRCTFLHVCISGIRNPLRLRDKEELSLTIIMTMTITTATLLPFVERLEIDYRQPVQLALSSFTNDTVSRYSTNAANELGLTLLTFVLTVLHMERARVKLRNESTNPLYSPLQSQSQLCL